MGRPNRRRRTMTARVQAPARPGASRGGAVTPVPAPRLSPRLAIALGFAAIYLIWGSTYLAIRVAVADLPPFLMAGSRFLVAGAMLLAWTRWRGAAMPSRREWLAALLIGGL